MWFFTQYWTTVTVTHVEYLLVSHSAQFWDLYYLCCTLYINDLPNNISSTIRLNADDAIIYRIIHSNDDIKLQEDLNTLGTPMVTTQVCFSTYPNLSPYTMYFKQMCEIKLHYKCIIKKSNQHNTLDTITHNLSWKEHVAKKKHQ